MVNYKEYISNIERQNLNRDQGIIYLKNCLELVNEDKLLIYSYCFPRHLGDRELPMHIQKVRRSQGNNGLGWLIPNFRESCVLVEAYRSRQYYRFMLHLMHSFLSPELLSSCSGEGEDTCPLCGKKIFYHDSWNQDLDSNGETLAIMSKESSVCLCKDCTIQLFNCYTMITKIEGEDFLSTFSKRS